MATAPYRETLPASWFYDPEHYRREEQAIWQRDWVCVGRAEDWPQSGDFQRLRIGGQQIVVTRAEDCALHAWHNTCRHRGTRRDRHRRIRPGVHRTAPRLRPALGRATRVITHR